MRTLSIILVLCLLTTLAHAEDRRTDPDKLVIMSWNVEFMWDGLRPEEGNERVTFEHRGNPKLAAEKMAKIAEIIRKENPDIISLDEVENLDALKLLNDKFLSGMGYKPYLKNGRDDFTGQDVGILTRIDPDEPLWREDRRGQSGDSSKSASKNYIAKFTIGEDRIALIGLHLYSRPSDRKRMHDRQAQARSILRAAQELDDEGYHVIIAGDINDYDGSPEASDHESNQPISTVLSELRGMNESTPTDDLINVAKFVPKQRRYTAHWDQNNNDKIDGKNELTSIDHILVAPELAVRVTEARIQNNFDPHGISDHFPIIVTISTDPNAEPSQVVVAVPVTSPLRLIRVLPKPADDEKMNESVTLLNTGDETISLVGWELRDKSGGAWLLDEDGEVESGAEIIIKRNGRRMVMNNGGDELELVNPGGAVVQSMSYTWSRSDEAIEVGR